MKLRLALALLLGACAAAPPPRAPGPTAHGPPAAADLAWLAGRWVMTTSGGSIEEAWLPPAGGTLYGVGRTTAGDTTRFFEFLSIEPRPGPDGPTLAYVARPRGAAPTEFLLVELGAGRVVFENRAHDFPRRIIYERRGEGLHARVDDGSDGGEGEDFDYRRGE